MKASRLQVICLMWLLQQVLGSEVPQPGDVVINEFRQRASQEFVELYNTKNQEFNLTGCFFDDGPGGTNPIVIGEAVIEPYGFYVFYSVNRWNDDEDTIQFLSPSQEVIESYTYTFATAPDSSRYRWPDGSLWSNFEDLSPTPGASNNDMGPSVAPHVANSFEIRLFDVGQGDSQLVIFPSGFSILIDLKEASYNTRKGAAEIAIKIRKILGGTHINVGVISHLHLDHLGYAGYGGFWSLLELENITFDKIIDRNYGYWLDTNANQICDNSSVPGEFSFTNMGTSSGTAWNWICYATDQNNTRIYPIREPAVLFSTTQIDPPDANAVVEIISTDGIGGTLVDGVTPLIGDHSALSLPPSENEYSIALKISFGEIVYVTGGDLGGDYAVSSFGYTYNDMESVIAPRVGQADIVKLNHHGSEHSSNNCWLGTMSASVYLATCGTNNSYSHPGLATLQRLQNHNATLFISQLCQPYVANFPFVTITYDDIVIRSLDGVEYTLYPSNVTYQAVQVKGNNSLESCGTVPLITFDFFGASNFTAERNATHDVNLESPITLLRSQNIAEESASNAFNSRLFSYDFTETKFLTFSVTPKPNFLATYLSFEIEHRRSNTGPVLMSLRTSLDNFTSELYNFTVSTDPISGSASIPDHLSLNQTIEFRLFPYRATNVAGTYRVSSIKVTGRTQLQTGSDDGIDSGQTTSQEGTTTQEATTELTTDIETTEVETTEIATTEVATTDASTTASANTGVETTGSIDGVPIVSSSKSSNVGVIVGAVVAVVIILVIVIVAILLVLKKRGSFKSRRDSIELEIETADNY